MTKDEAAQVAKAELADANNVTTTENPSAPTGDERTRLRDEATRLDLAIRDCENGMMDYREYDLGVYALGEAVLGDDHQLARHHAQKLTEECKLRKDAIGAHEDLSAIQRRLDQHRCTIKVRCKLLGQHLFYGDTWNEAAKSIREHSYPDETMPF